MITTTTHAGRLVWLYLCAAKLAEFQCSMARLAYADPRTRSKSSLRSFSARENLTPSTIVVPLAVQSLRVLALATSKEWLLERHYGSTWVLTRSLLVAASLAVCWWVSRRRNVPPIDAGVIVPSVALFVQYWSLLEATSRLPIYT